MASETPTISIKLLIDQDSNNVLLAEAGNDFVNTLYSPSETSLDLLTSTRVCSPFSFKAPNRKESTEKDGKTRVKTMLRKSERKIVLVEASENFVDLLFSFLTIPLESVLELVLGTEGNLTLGSIFNLFRDLNIVFSLSKQKDSQKGVLPPFYSCPYEFPNIRSRDPHEFLYGYTLVLVKSPHEGEVVNKPLDPKSPKPSTTNSLGYVEKNSFVVTDDLKVISIGEVEAIALLGASLWSSSALSALLNFFSKKPKLEPL
ncbi:hypothetical protein like AT3G09140 [Hibiscus trionum]|uniref:DUF674 family protein n=1 Tax=Hibiscus trionum TaxID=183268 RepID=A0A9W7HZ03_HIBTR|nr:hypothetical protein like AT3G09140 [Hibiscus trionum]